MRRLRPSIRTALTITCIILVVFLASLNDFELSAIPFIFICLALLLTFTLILTKY